MERNRYADLAEPIREMAHASTWMDQSCRGRRCWKTRGPGWKLGYSGRRALASFTMYGELSVANVQEEFAPLRMRLQQEWIFDAGFVSRFIILFS
jgi:hypothetical protein